MDIVTFKVGKLANVLAELVGLRRRKPPLFVMVLSMIEATAPLQMTGSLSVYA